VGGGNRYRAELVEGQKEIPELIAAPQHEHDRVALGYAAFREVIRRPVGGFGEVGEAEAAGIARIVAPDHRLATRFLAGIAVDDIVGEI